MDGKEELTFKFLLVGESQAGKTEICKCAQNPQSAFSSQTVEVTFRPGVRPLKIEEGNDSYSIQLWDTPGRTDYFDENVKKEHFLGSHAVLIVLDGAQYANTHILSMTEWVNETKKLQPNALIYFMFSKTDGLSDTSTFQTTADAWNMEERKKNPNHQNISAFFVSAKLNTGIREALTQVAKDCHAKMLKEQNKSNSTFNPEQNKDSTTSVPQPIFTLPNITFLGYLKKRIEDNPIRTRGNALLILALVILLILAAFPVGAFLAVGPLSAFAMAAIIGGGLLLLWNVGCDIANTLKNRKPGPRGGGSVVADNLPQGSLSNYVPLGQDVYAKMAEKLEAEERAKAAQQGVYQTQEQQKAPNDANRGGVNQNNSTNPPEQKF